ncbi:MAG: hypothetical protein ACOC1O_01045 [bacterium]
MFKNNIPYFKKGNILKKSMLINLRDYPRSFVDIYFDDFSDGILAGCNIFIDDNYFCINKGIIKFKNIIYQLDEVKRIKYFHTNTEIIVKIKVKDIRQEKDFICHESKIILNDKLKMEENEFELGRFKLREGARLRSEYNDFADFATEFNTVNIINVSYSNVERSTLHPLIIKTFAKKFLQFPIEDTFDLSFVMQCLNTRVIDRTLLERYLINKLTLEEKEYTNFEIYRYLKSIIKGLSGVGGNQKKSYIAPKIIVD